MVAVRSRQSRSTKRRRDILAASLRCFLKHGVEAATIEQIRQNSGASSGSIYHHFGSKHGIAVALYVEGQEELARVFRKAMENQRSLRKGIDSIIDGYCRWMADNPDWAMYLLRVATADLPIQDAAAIDAVNREIRNDLIAWLRPFRERGELADIPEDLYASIVYGSCSNFIRHWLAGRQQTDPLAAIPYLAHTTWRALTTAEQRNNAQPSAAS